MPTNVSGVRTIWSMLAVVSVTITIFAFTGCGTVSPSPVKDLQPSYDSTTPGQYPNDSSGILSMTTDAKGDVSGALITDGARSRFNSLVALYRLQYRQKHLVLLNPDDGISKAKDIYGNSVWLIDAEHLECFINLNLMSKGDVPPDSMWQKIKSTVSE